MGTAALLVLVGPSDEEVTRLADLLQSVEHNEPGLEHCVLVDDSDVRAPRDLTADRLGCRTLRTTVVPHPRGGGEAPKRGALITGVQAGLAHLAAIPDLDFALKIDTDALVIAPFRAAVSACLHAHGDVGLIGCRGETCDRAHLLYLDCLRRRSPFAVAVEGLDRVSPHGFDGASSRRFLGGVDLTPPQYHALLALRTSMRQAVANGLARADYCQGGAYAVSGTLIRRMRARGIFDEAMHWLPLPFFGEDEVMAMYCHAMGMRLYDCSNQGEPFGITFKGLPFNPAALISRRHALIHSLKGDPRYREAEIREFFAARRARRSADVA